MDEAEKQVQHILANSELEHIKDYADRGRQFESLETASLEGIFIDAHTAWSRDIANRALQGVTNDLAAEYRLRGIDPPYEVVREQIDVIGKTIAAKVAALDADRIYEINQELLEEYQDLTRSEN